VLPTTVRDGQGRLVSDLRKQDFEVYEDGVLQRLRLFRHEDVPVTVGLVVDHSGSMQPKLAEVTAAARAFVQQGFLSQYQNTAELTKWLNRQLDEIKAKLERTQQALRNFERDHQVVNPEDRGNILNLQLATLQQELTRTQAERLRKQSAFQSVSAGDLESLAVSEQGEPLLRLAERHRREAREQ